MFSQTGISGNSARFWKISAVGRWFGPHAAHVLAADADHALGRLGEAGDHAQDRRLAAARRAQEREELARLDVNVDMVDGPEDAEVRSTLCRDRHPRSCVRAPLPGFMSVIIVNA